jgi:pseudouridine-5'-phosphate glycosidase
MSVQVSAEVAAALASGRPVVALESAIVTHGLPHPHNLDVARAAEALVRERDCTPATIAVVEGRARVGLDDSDLCVLASAEREHDKLSARDLGPAIALGSTGGTTVAATAHLAARSAIRVFATGGIGGVHRGASRTWDVSADLLALRDSSVVVVCSGVKSILDLDATLEYLETASVAIASYGSDTLPGFYVVDSGVAAPWRFDSPADVARAFVAGRDSGSRGALVVANPPDPQLALEAREHDEALSAAEADARRLGIAGKAVTPFLLGELSRRSEGRTLSANKELVLRNVALAADIATALAELDAPRR